MAPSPFSMTLRTKTLLLVALTLVVLLAVIAAVSAFMFNVSLKALETQESLENVGRVRDAIAQRLSQMNTTTTSWAQWTDTCQYLRDRNRKYYNANLTAATITTMKSDVVVFVNEKGQIIFGTNHDLKAVKNHPLDPEVRALITPDSALLHHVSPRLGHTGIWSTPHSLLLVASRPIVNDTATGAIHGTLLTANYLDADELKQISQVTHLPLTLHRALSAPLPADFQRARPHLPVPNSHWTFPLSEDVFSAYTLMPDIFGKPAFLLRVDLKRDIFHRGQVGIHRVLVSLLICGFVFGLVTVVLLERLVVSRIALLSDEVQRISAERDFAGTVSATGNDELTGLAHNVNTMLQALQTSLVKEATDRQQIEASLREKDVLLKEVYHRVKNNLQIVSSLLSLQADTIEDPQVQSLFEESRNRVYSMALVHEKLYQSNDLGRVDFGEYLDDLAHTLVRSYGSDRGQVALEVKAEEAVLDIDRAIPCGLIVNELVTNSLKYAFPEGQGGTISVNLRAQDEGMLALCIADDGVGLPENFKPERSESIGMQLVTGLTRQLRGKCELNGNNGTKWTIIFKGQQS